MQSKYLPSLDGFRALSIALVVICHALAVYPPTPRVLLGIFDGALGVRIFFVISGFLITTLLLREQQEAGRISLRNFYARRFLRLAPVQVTYIAVLIVVSLMTQLRYTPCQALSAVTYTKNYFCTASADGHLWSLSVEEQFYLVWPMMLTLLPRRWAVAGALAMIAAAPVSRAIQYQAGDRLFAWLPSNADVLMIGCLTALVTHRWPERLASLTAYRKTAGRVIAVAVIASIMVLRYHYMLGAFTVTLGPLIQGLCIAYLIASLVLHRGLGYAILNLAPVRYLGRISYGLYVWQQFFVTPAADYGYAWALLLTFPVNIGFAVFAAVLSHHMLELPFLKLRRFFRGENRRTGNQEVARSTEPAVG